MKKEKKSENHDYEEPRSEPLYDNPHNVNKRCREDSMKMNGAYGSAAKVQKVPPSVYKDSMQLNTAYGSANHISQPTQHLKIPNISKSQPIHVDSMQTNRAHGSAKNIFQSVDDLKIPQISTSLREGQGFMMNINEAYGSLRTPY